MDSRKTPAVLPSEEGELHQLYQLWKELFDYVYSFPAKTFYSIDALASAATKQVGRTVFADQMQQVLMLHHHGTAGRAFLWSADFSLVQVDLFDKSLGGDPTFEPLPGEIFQVWYERTKKIRLRSAPEPEYDDPERSELDDLLPDVPLNLMAA